MVVADPQRHGRHPCHLRQQKGRLDVYARCPRVRCAIGVPKFDSRPHAGQTPLRPADPDLRPTRTPRPAGRCRRGCGRRTCVDARHGRPELVLAHPGRREGRLLARVGVRSTRPRSPSRAVCGRVLERRCPRGRPGPPRSRGSPRGSRSSRRRSGRAPPSARSRSARSSACRPPGRTSWARGSRSPSAASRCRPPRCRPLLERPHVDDELVRDAAVPAREQDRVVAFEAARPCSSRSGSRPRVARRQAVRAHQRDVDPRDGEDARGCRTARRRPRPPTARRPCRVTGWPGRNGARCAATPIGPMPGPPPPCGMQKVLCRFRWQTSAPMSPGPREADLRVHVRAVHVDLPAVLVHDLADLADRLLEHAVRRRIRDHQRAQAIAGAPPPCARRSARSMLPCSSQATATTLKPAITALRGIGAVRGDRDQADVARGCRRATAW